MWYLNGTSRYFKKEPWSRIWDFGSTSCTLCCLVYKLTVLSVELWSYTLLHYTHLYGVYIGNDTEIDLNIICLLQIWIAGLTCILASVYMLSSCFFFSFARILSLPWSLTSAWFGRHANPWDRWSHAESVTHRDSVLAHDHTNLTRHVLTGTLSQPRQSAQLAMGC